MPNGTGKTTTMQLLTAVLTAHDWTVDEVQALRPTVATTSGGFELRLLVDNQPLSLAVEFDFVAGTAEYSTTRVRALGGGKEPGILLPDLLRAMLTKDFARLVVFDGELARHIRDLKRNEAALAIQRLYRLELIDTLSQTAERYLESEKLRALSSRAKTNAGLKKKQALRDEAEYQLGQLLVEREDLDRQRDKHFEDRARFEGLITTRVGVDSKRKALLESKRADEQTAVADTRAASQRLLELLRTPATVHERVLARLRALGGKLDQLKLPQTMSQEFFHELADQDVCVCGRPISATEHDAILARAPHYLAENQIAIINAMKSAIRTATAEHDELQRLADAINVADRRRRLAAEAVQALVEDAAAEGDLAIAKAQSDLMRVANLLAAIESRLEVLSGPIPAGADAWKRNIKAAQAEFEARKRALDDATETRRLALQTAWLTDVLHRVRARAEARLTEDIRARTNQKLIRLIPSESIEVARIDGALVLSSDEGGARGGVSEGQSLAVAYAFLTSLFEAASYQLPFVVDSPAVSLDVRVRREVASLVPDLFHQMIMFVISSEREGFADGFYAKPGARFITVWRNQAGEVNMSQDLAVFKAFHTDVEPDAESAGVKS